MPSDVLYEVTGLTRIEAERVRLHTGVTVTPVPIPDGAYGEPVTFTMVVTLTGLSALAAYLLRKGDDQEFREEVTTIHPDGRRETRRVHWRRSTTEAPESGVIKAIQGR